MFIVTHRQRNVERRRPRRAWTRTLIEPSCSSTIFRATARPRPVPRLPLVEWNSSNMCGIMLGAMPVPLSITSMTDLVVLHIVARHETDQSLLRLHRIQGVAQQVHQHLVHAVGIQRDRRMILIDVGHHHHALLIGRRRHQLQALVRDRVDVDQLQPRLALLAVGQQVHRQVVDLVEVALDDAPALAGLGDVAGR